MKKAFSLIFTLILVTCLVSCDKAQINNNNKYGEYSDDSGKVLLKSIDIGKKQGLQACYDNINKELNGDNTAIKLDTEICAYLFKDYNKLIDRKELKIKNTGDGYADIKVIFSNKSLFDYSYLKYDIYFYNKNEKIIDTDWNNSDKLLKKDGDIVIETSVKVPKGTVKFNVIPSELTSDKIENMFKE